MAAEGKLMNELCETGVSGATTATGGKFLTFKLGAESYGINVLAVREIISLTAITAVPQMPPDVRGVINLRGKIIPVLDLRRRFGFADATDTKQTCIIVVQARHAAGKAAQQGLLVDNVEEVIQINANDVAETPDFGGTISADFIVGMAKIKNTVKALLAIDRVLGATETPGASCAMATV